MAFVTLEDGADDVEITVFPRVLEASGDLLREDSLVGIAVTADARNGEVGLIADEILSLREVSKRMSLSLLLTIDTDAVDEDRLARLQSELTQHAGAAPVCLRLVDPLGSVVVRAHDRFSVAPSEELCSTLTTLPGIVNASFRTKR